MGDDAGGLTALDVRMLADGRQLWASNPHGGSSGSSAPGVSALAAWDGGCEAPEALTAAAAEAARRAPPMRLADVVVSGGRDGSIAVVNVHSGTAVQVVEAAHWTEKRGLLGGRLGGASLGGAGSPHGGEGPLPARRARPGGAAGAAVTGLAACPEGLLSGGADGAVRFFPLSHVWA